MERELPVAGQAPLERRDAARNREAILAADASLLYLLSYSPDLNPIEQAFAKLKTLWRKTGARSREALGITIGDRWMLAGPRKAATTSSTAATRSMPVPTNGFSGRSTGTA